MAERQTKGNFTGGSLLLRESRIVAGLLADKHGSDEIIKEVLGKNLFQNSSKATTHKYCQLALFRLGKLTDDQLRFVVSGSEDLCKQTLLFAILKTYSIIADFMVGVMVEKVRCFETHLDKNDWMRFLDDRAKGDPSVKEWSEKSQRKMGQVVIRMLAEAGFLDNTRKMTILFPAIAPELEHTLSAVSDGKLLTCMRLGQMRCKR